MKIPITNNKLFTGILFFIAIICQKQLKAQATGNITYNWALAAASSTNIGGNSLGKSIVTDINGNTYVTGTFEGVADFDPSAAEANLVAFGGTDIFFAKYDINGNYVYAKKMGGPFDDSGNSIAVDASGIVYVTGSYSSTADFDPSAITNNLVSLGGSDIFFAKYDAMGNYIYAKSIGGTNIDEGFSIATDGTGAAYITGYYAGTVDFDPSATNNILTSISASRDIFIAKYDFNGNYIYAKSIGGSGLDYGYSISTNTSGVVYITGIFSGIVDFDPSVATATLSSTGASDIFFAKYDATGNYLMAKKIGGANSKAAYSIATDAVGDLYLTGFFSGTVDFDPSAAVINLSSFSSSFDIFFAKYDSNGNYIFAKRIGGTSSEQGNSIVVDANGAIYITGTMAGTIDFDPSAAVANLIGIGAQDAFFAKYDQNGNYVYAKILGSTSSDYSNAIAINLNGDVCITGQFYGTADFDPNLPVSNLVAPYRDAFVGRYDQNGSYVWAKQLGNYFNSAGAIATCIKKDAAGNTYVTGYYNGSVDFDPSAASAFLTPTLYNDLFFAKYDVNGNYIFAKSIGGNADDVGTSLALDASGNIYITGYFCFTVDFDPSPATATLVGVNNEIFIAKYDANGNYIYAKSMGGTNHEYGNAIAVDVSGSAYITGNFSGTADFDPSAATAFLTSAGNTDIFIAKYDPFGNYVYAGSIGSSGPDDAFAIAIDASNAVYITGPYQGICDFDPSTAVANLTCTSSQHMYFAKYDANGNYVFAKTVTGFGIDYGRSIAVDASNSIYITGAIVLSASDFDPSPAVANLSPVSSSSDFFIAKYDANGNYIFAKSSGGPGNEGGYCIAIDNNNEIYITGVFDNTADFDPSASISNITSFGSSDIFIAKYDANGNYVFAKRAGGAGIDKGNSIIVDGAGSKVTIAGYFNGVSDFDPNASVVLLNSNLFDAVYIADYNTCIAPPSAINITAASNQTICSGTSAYLTASATGTVSWYLTPTSTLTLYSGTSYTTPVLTTGNYTFYIENNDACAPSAYRVGIPVTVNPLPTLTVNNGSICSGDSFTINPTGAISYTYSGGSAIVAPVTNTNYLVIGAAVNGCTNSTISSITVNALPLITVNSGSICSGNSFTMMPTGASSYTFSSGNAVVSPSVNTSYSVTGTSTAGCISSNIAVANVTVTSLTLPTISVNNGTICSGESFTIVPNGALTYTYSGGTAVVSPSISTNYSVTGTDVNGCISSNVAVSNVSVNPSPNTTVNSGSICTGSSFTMVPGGAFTYTFSSPSAIVSPTVNSTYTVYSTAVNGCTATVLSSVTVNSLPVITVNDSSVCIGSSYTLNPTGASTYTYSGGSAIVSPTVNTSYSITGTSAAGCLSSNTAVANITVNALPVVSVNSGSICAGDSFTLVATGANTYTFSSGSNIVSPLSTSNIFVIGTGTNGCLSSNLATATITVNQTPTITVNNGSVCSGGSFTLLPAGASSYTFSSGLSIVSPTITTSYSVTGTSTNGCISLNPAISTITVMPTPSVSVNSGAICTGNSFTMVPSGASSYTYSNGSSIVSPTVTTSYTVSGSNTNGCISNLAVSTITVVSIPSLSITSSSSLICTGQSVTLSASGANSYTWSTGANTPNISFNPTTTTIYFVSGSSIPGCSNSITFTQFVTICTGIQSQKNVLAQNVVIYPNPTSNVFFVEISNETPVSILNSVGQVVYECILPPGTNQLNLNQHAKGIYFIQLKIDNNFKTLKLIKD